MERGTGSLRHLRPAEQKEKGRGEEYRWVSKKEGNKLGLDPAGLRKTSSVPVSNGGTQKKKKMGKKNYI